MLRCQRTQHWSRVGMNKRGQVQDHAACTEGEWGGPLEVVEKGTRGSVPVVPSQIEEIE